MKVYSIIFRIVLMDDLQFDMYLILLKLQMAFLLMIIIHSNQEFYIFL